MRFLYIDEAGTAPKEPVRVVAAVVVEVDSQLAHMQEAVKDVYADFVPGPLKKGFVFHTTDIFSGKKYNRSYDWELQDRLDLIKAVLSIPRAFKAPISFASVFTNSVPRPIYLPKKIKMHEFEHMFCFGHCLERASHFLRNDLHGAELALVVAESIDKMERNLRNTFSIYEDMRGLKIPVESQRISNYQAATGSIEDYVVSIDNIIPHAIFIKKGVSPILDVADACAFTLRRWLSNLPHSKDLLYCMLGVPRTEVMYNDPVWTTPPGSFGFITHLP